MTAISASVRSARARLVADGDCGLTLVELMVTMVLTAILLAVVIAPLNTLTNVTGSTVSISQATASARAVFQDMSAGVTSSSQICLPTQLNSTQTATPGAAVRVKTNVFGTVKWEQWWLNPSTNQLLAQSWAPTSAPSTSWRTVANNVSSVSPPSVPFAISPTGGRISTTGTLAAGTYTATGTTSDGNLPPDTGTWTYILYVTPTAGTIIQTTPKSGTVTATGSATFTDQLAVTGGTVTYTQSNPTVPGLTVTSSGLVATIGTLTAGTTYTATGTTSDGSGGTGTWAYALYVYSPTASTIVQTTPILGTVTATGSATFTDQLAVTGNSGTVTYTQSNPTVPGLTITSLPAAQAAVELTVAITASSGTKRTAVSVPLTSAITTLDTVFAAGAGNCMVGLG